MPVLFQTMRRERRQCPHFTRCGGCDMLDLRYCDELEEKRLEVEHYLSRFSKVAEVVPSERILAYRCKVQAVCGMEKGHLVTGIYRRGTHTLLTKPDSKPGMRTEAPGTSGIFLSALHLSIRRRLWSLSLLMRT